MSAPEELTEVFTKIAVFWDVTPRCLVHSDDSNEHAAFNLRVQQS
jgi:hypothetical protein